MLRALVLLGASLVLPSVTEPLLAADALPWVRLHDDGRTHGDDLPAPDSGRIYRAWPFCPTDRIPCSERELAWVELAVGIDAYSLRRNDPHDSIRRVLDVTASDLRPLTLALARHFEAADVTSHAARVAFVHGLVQGINYSFDTTTGWTEYPKFGIEFLVDEQGDCDDAAVLLATLLQGLGYEAWFVSWVSSTPGDPEGHLSNAVTRFPGDLASFQPPDGSAWIPGPGNTRLLHVDSTGNPEGCGQAWVDCGSLGFNPWPERGLRPVKVIRADDAALQEKLPISAWNNGGLDRPDRTFVDRRDDSERTIREELQDGPSAEERARRRLRQVTNSGVELSPVTFYFFVGFCLLVLATFAGHAWRAHQRRLARAEQRRGDRQGRDF